MFGREMQKLFGKRITKLLILVILLGNGLLLYINEMINPGANEASASSYAALQKDMEGLSEEEQNAYIEEGLQRAAILDDILFYQTFGGYDEGEWTAKYPEISYEEAQEEARRGTLLRYTEDPYAEQRLYREVEQEMEQVREYTGYVQQTLERTLASLRSMEERNSFAFRNLTGIYFAYDGVKDVSTVYGPSRGISRLVNTQTTDIWVFLFLLMMAVLLVTVEREKRLLILVKSTKNGRGKLGVQKLLALYVCCLLAMLLYVENYLILNALYGMGDLGRSIQSVAGFQGCVLKVSAGQFLLLCFLMKLLFYLMCVTLLYLVCTLFMRSLWVYIAAVGAAAGFGILYSSISNTSGLFAIKALSPFGLLRVGEYLGSYRNLKLGPYAINRVTASLFVMAIVLTVGAAGGIVSFALKKERESRAGGFRLQLFENMRLYGESHTCSLAHEAYKVFAVQRVFLILAATGILVYLTFSPVRAESGEEALYYKEFVQSVQGPAEAVPQEEWNLLMQRYEEQLALAFDGTGSEEQISHIQEAMRALERVKSHGAYLETKPGSWYLYDEGYGILTGIHYQCETKELLAVFLAAAAGIFCFCGIYSVDYQNGGIRLLQSTRNGRGRLTANKIGLGMLTAAVLYGFSWLPQLLFTLHTYGTGGIAAPVYSIERLSWLPGEITIGGYLLLLYLIRYLGICIFMLFAFAVTAHLKHFIVSCFVAGSVVLVPVGMALLKVNFMRFFLLTPLLLGDVLFLDGGGRTLALGLLQGMMVLVFSIWLLKKA